ncbi:platelet-derived growth factor receptor-like protein, partial [Empidonax traillii]|uniref:platelet-derived growth factor receptor-like protein n=1 Tax=Empidonax traillii TaxID=164674 RepID=UPI000FFD46E9
MQPGWFLSLLLLLLLLQETLPHVIGQPAKSKHPKEHGENKVFSKKVKPKPPKMKERESADSSLKSHSILTQVMDKGRFQKLAATLTLSAGQSIELRCKGSNVLWNYPSYLDTFKDSRLRVITAVSLKGSCGQLKPLLLARNAVLSGFISVGGVCEPQYRPGLAASQSCTCKPTGSVCVLGGCRSLIGFERDTLSAA